MAAYLTPRQVAERWSCSARHVRRLCASGELTAMRLGLDAWRIGVSAVEAYELAHTSGAVEAPPATTSAPKPKEVRPPAVVDGFTLPDGYEPVFPDLWGVGAPTKKAPVSSR